MTHSFKQPFSVFALSISLCLVQACRQAPETESELSKLEQQHSPLIHEETRVDRHQEVFDGDLAEAITLGTGQPDKIQVKRHILEQDAIQMNSALGHVHTKPAMGFHNRQARVERDLENYAHLHSNGVSLARENPVSTFSIDVDTGSYANSRRMLMEGRLPVQDAVRVEEFINYFSYDYPTTPSVDMPFNVVQEVAVNPWNPDNYLLHIGIKAFEPEEEAIPASNLVFLVDVSGSMKAPNKLSLLQASLKMLTQQLDAEDTVSLVVYAGASGVVLEPTSGDNKAKILAAIQALSAGGSTNGAAGIDMAYAMAEQALIPDGINRVILATDGDFNVGTVSHEQLMDLIEAKRKSGIALSTLGFGTGNYNDHLMEQLADQGNGNYAYIDTLNEAQKVLVDESSSTLLTVAKDVKIQVEFNPALISEYRLVGYENRLLNREDFNNDKVDAGEIGAGHTVTAIYEITPVDSLARRIEPLRYQRKEMTQMPSHDEQRELAFIKLRYKKPNADVSQLSQWPIMKDSIIKRTEESSDNFRFSAAVAAFAQQLKGGEHLRSLSYDGLLKLVQSSKGDDISGYRGEFTHLLRLANSLGLFNNTGHTVARIESTSVE